MFKKVRVILFAVLMMTVSVLGACGSQSASLEKQDPKELIGEAMNKSMELNSYRFEGDFALSLDLDESLLTAAEAEMLYATLQDFKINYSGAWQADIEKAEFIFETNLNLGDLKTLLEIPIVVEKEKVWIKIPSIPGIVPDEYAGQQLELDMKQLAEMRGEGYISMFDTAHPENEDQLALVQKIMDIFIKHLDESLFSSSSQDGETVVTVDISGDKFNSSLETLFRSTLPEVIELLEEQNYADLLGLTADDLAYLKEWKNAPAEDIDEMLAEIEEMLHVNKGEFVFHINKDKFVTKQNVTLDLIFNDPEEDLEFKLILTSAQQISMINEEQTFHLDVPTDNILDFSAMFGMFMPFGMGGDFAGLDGIEFNDTEHDLGMDLDADWERMDQLFNALFEQDWFLNPEVQELLFSNPSFQEKLDDLAFLEQLINDEAFRKAVFADYGIQID